MQATKETVQKRPHTALWVILCVVLLCAAGAALYFCRWAEKPLTLAEGVAMVQSLRQQGQRMKDAVRRTAEETGLSRNDLYNAALAEMES